MNMVSAIAGAIWVVLLIAMSVAWFFDYRRFLRHLRECHPEHWRSLGSPRATHVTSRFLLCAALVSCAAQPVVAPVKVAPAPPVRFDAVLLPGCLLPAPSLLAQASRPGATMTVSIDAAGSVSSAVLASSTGSAELDASLQAAMRRCRFAPAYEVDRSTHSRMEVPEGRTLGIHWPSPPAEFGPHRCFTPDYPHTARRAEEQGRIVAMFRKSSATGEVESQLRSDSAPLRTLRALSLAAVSACMAHEEARAMAPADKWVSILYDWRLN